ncbi:MAG: ABC transporter permease [Candidatus Rokubacteria bacterium 13_1_20CM_4_70_14]|nr:MAG: ABC transporter permease [Candidatus Rokubacteria bacterium 13_2_20CM_69_15_2]OLD76653.1 MAG: ABC transporter permease [Candidatus Rokubacteria bacterium 13_1_20CM_4_70_14]PYO24649.1 MAG: ABC transporter permease [Candidatus Rokubacteria bacterium]
MTLKTLMSGALAAALVAGPMAAAAPAQPKEMFIPLLVYRTGPYAPSGIPIANGFVDYFTLLNERDGGINGVKLTWEECETQYKTDLGIECYEKLKGKGPTGAAVVNPYSTGITYQLIPKASVDKVPVFSMGYGMTAAADGRWFPWVFSFPTTYWSQASAVIRYMAQQEGGMDKLRGKKIVHIFHNSPYGKEANPTLETLARQMGFELTLLAVDHPGQEQGATWLQVRRINPDWIFMSGWGVMNQVAVKEAASKGFKMDHFIGNWWSANESDVVPAGDGAKGYKGATFHAPGTNFKVHADLFKFVYDKGKGGGNKDAVGEALYNRGLVNAMLSAEAIRTAMTKYGNKPLTGEQVRWGMENLNLTEQRLEQLGVKGFTHPIKVTCEDHEGNGPVLIQQWDGKKWTIVSDWISPMRDVVRAKIETAAVEEGKKLGYAMRDCAKEK